MRLDLGQTDNTCSSDVGHLAGGADVLDFGDKMRPNHPMLVVDRIECDLDANSDMSIPPEVLGIRVVDAEGRRAAHFHIRVGVKKGRPFVDLCALGRDSSTDNKKKATGAWLPITD